MENKHKKVFASSLVMSLVFTTALANTGVMAEEVSTSSFGRLYGSNRYETSVSVSNYGWKDGCEYVILASGEDFADALCAAPLAKAKKAPILLTSKNSLNPKVKKEIQRLRASNVIIVGGNGAVSESIKKEVQSIKGVKKVDRISGKNRYETSLKIAKELGQPNDVAVVTGNQYADALSIASIAAQKQMPILMTARDNMDSEVLNYIKHIKNIDNTYVIGGTGAVSQNVQDKLPNAKRLFGQNRFETNTQIMKEFKNEINFKKIYLSRGNGPKQNEFADALAGSVLASKTNSPVILVDSQISENTKNFVKGEVSPTSEIVALGGQAAVKDSILNEVKLNGKQYSENDKKYGLENADNHEQVEGNAIINGKNSELNNTDIKGNLYIENEGIKINNVKVNGIIYINQKGAAHLNNVEAKEIRVLNSASHSVYLKGVKCDKLSVEIKNEGGTTINSQGNNEINKTVVTSSAVLDASSGDLGNIEINQSSQKNKKLELKGKFQVVTLKGKTNVQVDKSSKIKEMKLENEGKESKVEVSKGAVIEKADEDIEFRGDGAKDVGKGDVSTGGSSGSSSGSSSGGSSSGGSPSTPEDPDKPDKPDKSEISAKVRVNGDTITIDINNIKDDEITLKVMSDNGKYENFAQLQKNKGDIINGNASYTFKVSSPGTYYGVIIGKKSGKFTTEKFEVKKVVPSEDFKVYARVNGTKVTLKFDNISKQDNQLTIKICNKENGDIVHVGQLESSEINNGHAEYTLTVDSGTYYGEACGRYSGKIRIEEFRVK